MVSSTVEAGQTVACISIPDSSTPEVQQTISRNGNSCKTLSDVIDSVLTPENRLALTQPECAPTTVMTVAPTTAQQAVLIRQDGTQMVLCAAETVATQLQGSGEARIIYPPGTVVIESITSPCESNDGDLLRVKGSILDRQIAPVHLWLSTMESL